MAENQKPTRSEQAELTYRSAGVDIGAGNKLVDAIKPMIKATNRAGVLGAIGGFGGLFDLKATGLKDPLLVAANDGVGTKLKLAFETGTHDTVGIDLVAMCVNALIVQGAEPLFFLDYFACGALEGETAETVISGIAKGCEVAGCALLGGETAEMPGMYQSGEYDLAGFSVGAVERDELLPKPNIQSGNIVLGIASNGVHSNGFSLVRRVIEREKSELSAVAPFDTSRTLGEILLTPTKVYVKPILKALREIGHVNALAHITGGGLIENIPRVLPTGMQCEIDLGAIKPQAVFAWLKKAGNISDEEMLRTFNNGIGMIAVVERNKADELIECLKNNGETATVIGKINEGGAPFKSINQMGYN